MLTVRYLFFLFLFLLMANKTRKDRRMKGDETGEKTWMFKYVSKSCGGKRSEHSVQYIVGQTRDLRNKVDGICRIHKWVLQYIRFKLILQCEHVLHSQKLCWYLYVLNDQVLLSMDFFSLPDGTGIFQNDCQYLLGSNCEKMVHVG